MKKIKSLINKFITQEVILYAVFGVLTTVVNLVTFYVLFNLFHINENIANTVAVILAILFAYFTNKDFVFHSEAKLVKEKFKEFLKFISGRAFTMVLELVGGALLFLTPIPQMISKLFITIIIIILNFFISKFFAFKKK